MSKDFDAIFEQLSAFEKGLAEGTLLKPSLIKAMLKEIITSATVLSNRGKLPQGSKSVLARITKLCEATLTGLTNKEITFTELRLDISRDKLGPLHTLLVKSVTGTVTDADKEQARDYETDENKSAEINRLLKDYDPGKTLIGVTKYDSQDVIDDVGMYLSRNFTASQLRAITKEMMHDYTYEDFWNALHGKDAKQHAGIIKRELTKKHDDEYAQLSESYKHLKDTIPKQIPHGAPFTAIAHPVVPLFDDINAMKDPGKLERAGFKVTPVGDHFIVLDNQMLLCMDLERMGVSASLRPSRDKTKLKSVNNSSELMDAIEEVLEIVNRRAPKKFAIASQTIVRNPHNPKIVLVWIMTEHSRKMLEASLRTRRVDWDIPRHNIAPVRLSHGAMPEETRKLIDKSLEKHGSSKQTDASLRKHRELTNRS
ncbi:MAG: hypothetical protein WC052_05920 [Patescibacteria group bacterium]